VRRIEHHNGFTLIELVTVITILGVLAVFAAPKFLQSTSFESRTTQDLLLRTAQEAQQLAMTQGSGANVQLQIDNSNKRLRIQYTLGGTQTRDYPIPAGITVTDATLSYTALGDATPASTVVINADTTRRVCIETTGYAHSC
jgi:MSHA pilin protein MshC